MTTKKSLQIRSDTIEAPEIEACYTSWAVPPTDRPDVYCLVLHDREDHSLAGASYTIGRWRKIFEQLEQIHAQNERVQ